MFRLAEYSEEGRLYECMSSVASQTIIDAIDGWINTVFDIEELYRMYFSEEGQGRDFFEGLSLHIPMKNIRPAIIKCTEEPLYALRGEIGRDGLVGMELLWRKFTRMREKMADPAEYYTFDLFEEYLFDLMIEFYRDLDETDEEPNPEVQKKITLVGKKLKNSFKMEPAYAMELAASLCCIERMGINESDLFFWDDDFAVIFRETFVDGIRSITNGLGAVLGYGYEDACSIFTDAGFNVPLILTGTRAAYDVKSELAKDAMRKIPNPFDEPGDWDNLFSTDIAIDPDEELPFS